MAQKTARTVALPNGETVTAVPATDPALLKHGTLCYVDPALIAPDPKQPRKFMVGTKMRELADSVRERGVRQPIVVTPRANAAWALVESSDEKLPLLAVSGHRRRRAALEEGIGAVPVEVRIYPNEKEHRSDVSLLNKGQDPLSELEEAYEIADLHLAGWTYKELSAHYGWGSLTIANRINLTKLDLPIQQLLMPDDTGATKLQVTIAQNLGGVTALPREKLEEIADGMGEDLDTHKLDTDDERRFALQRLLLRVITARQLNSVRATSLIKDLVMTHRSHGAGGHHSGRHQPARRRDILGNLCKEVTGSLVVDWPPQEWERLLFNASREDVESLLKKVGEAADVFGTLTSILGRIRDRKKATRPEVLKAMVRA